VESERHPLGQVDDRLRFPGEVGAVEDEEVAHVAVGVIHE
jgi:hypothetical protein